MAKRDQDVFNESENSQAIPLVEFDEPQQPVSSVIHNGTPPQQEPITADAVPPVMVSPDTLKEPTAQQQTETTTQAVATQRPPRRAKSAWIKPPTVQSATPQQSAPTTGQQLAQQFNTYMQQQKRPAIRGTSPSYDLAIEAYGRRILTAICDASRVYEKSVTLHDTINENIRCTISINKDGKIQKIKLEPKTGNADMDKAIEGLCKVSALPKIPETLATNTFDFTVYFRLGRTQKGLNKVRFVPNTI